MNTCARIRASAGACGLASVYGFPMRNRKENIAFSGILHYTDTNDQSWCGRLSPQLPNFNSF